MSDIVANQQQIPNPYKEVKVYFSGGQEWYQALGGSSWTDYFPRGEDGACGLKLYLGGDRGVSLKVDSEFAPVLEELMNKFKNSTVGRAVGLIQKAVDVFSGIRAVTPEQQAASVGKSSLVQQATNNIRVLPPNVRYETKFQKLPAWKSTSPLNVGDFKFRFYLGQAGIWDARQEVYNPALAFMKVNQPSESGGRLQGPMPNTSWVYGVLGTALATEVKSAISKGAENAAANVAGGFVKGAEAERAEQRINNILQNTVAGLEKQLSDRLNTWPGNGIISIKIGQFLLPRMYVPKTSVDFSYDTDENGYPIWAEVTWSGCQTVEVATTGQMPLVSSKDLASPANATIPGAGTTLYAPTFKKDNFGDDIPDE